MFAKPFWGIPFLDKMRWAAESEQALIILQVSQNAARYAGLRLMAAIGRELRAQADVPVILHFDHAETPEIAL